MRILVALSRFPWPLEKGDKLRAFHQIKGLSRNNQIHLICLSNEEVSSASLKELDFCDSIHIIPHGKWRRYWNLFRGMFNRIPFQVNYFRSRRMKERIKKVIREEEIDVVVVQLIRLGLNLPLRSFSEREPSWFLDYMDCFSMGMENRISKSRWPVKPIVRIETQRLKKYEKQIAARFDEYSIISERDADGLADNLRELVHILPNGVSEHFFSLPAVIPAKRYDLIFFGNMGYQPNVESAVYLVDEVMPLLKKLGVEAKLCIAGARPAKSIKAFSNSQIEITGYVDDIRQYVLASHLAVAPVIGGQGLQNKLIESMALGIPTLTTPYSHQALGGRIGKDIVVCEDPASFAQKIKYYLEHKDEAEIIGKAGRRFVERNYRWDVKNRQLEEILLHIA